MAGIVSAGRAKLGALRSAFSHGEKTPAGPRVLAPRKNKLPVGMSARRLNSLAAGMASCSSYLEIGVAQGLTLEQIQVDQRCGVDPTPQFDVEKLPTGVSFFVEDSDSFFARISSDINFDLVFLDGLHQWQQTYRDLMHALRHSNAQTLIVIDDVIPDDELAAFPDWDEALKMKDAAGITDGRWQGDVFKVVLAIAGAHPELDYCTVGTSNDGDNPQTVVWRKNGEPFDFNDFGLSELEQKFKDVQYSDVFIDGKIPASFNPMDEITGIKHALRSSNNSNA